MTRHRFPRWDDPLRLAMRQFPAAVGWALALFASFNLIGGLIRQRFDADFLWMPILPDGSWLTRLLLGAFSFFLLWSLVRPPRRGRRYAATQALTLFMLVAAAAQVVLFYRDLLGGSLFSALPIPFDVLIVAALALQVWRIRREFRGQVPTISDPPQRVVATAAGIAVAWEIFLLGQFFLCGSVWRPVRADCIVVMGSGVGEDGLPSISMRDRTYVGCLLFNQGYAGHLIFTGGPGPGRASEPEVMAQLADSWDVPDSARVLDARGNTTYDTVRSVRPIMAVRGWRRAIVVSHDFHLSRTRLAFHRGGVEVATCPARRSRVTGRDFYNIFRESAAWTYYYLRPLWEPLPEVGPSVAPR